MTHKKHTPGPWAVLLSSRDREWIGAESTAVNGGGYIAEVTGPDREANAVLIAALPDFVGTVSALLGVVDCGKASAPDVIEEARALLSKVGVE